MGTPWGYRDFTAKDAAVLIAPPQGGSGGPDEEEEILTLVMAFDARFRYTIH